MAYGVSIGSDLAYGWEDQSTILVTVSTELNIAVCASENSSARYIDILLDRIESVSLEKRPRTSQANPLVPDNLDVLVIYLIKFSDNSLYLGAGKRFAPLINIAFTSVDEATVVLKRLLQRAPHIVEKFTCSESEPLNLSQPMVEENEEQGMLSAAAAQAPNTRPVIITSSTEPVSLPNFIREHEPDLSHSFLNWPKKFSAGPLNTTDLTDLRSDSGISIENIQVDSVVSRSHTPTKNLEDMSEGSLRNSAEWRKGAILIENAPELQDTKDRAVEKEELFGKYSSPDKVTFVDRDGDCDGFYNATPKGQAANVERAEHVSTHNERRQGLPQALDHTLVHRAKNHDSNKEFKADIGRNTVADAAELEIQASKNRGHVNVNMAEVRKSAVIKRKYTSNRKLPATNASKTSKKIANVKNQPDRKAESLGVNKGRFQRDKEGRDEFDFPLSPPKKRTPKTVRRPISKKAASKEGAIGSSTGKKPSAYRPVPPDEANHLVQNVAVQNNHPGTPPYKAPFESTKGKGPNDNPASINWDEKFVQDEKSNGLDLNPTEKRPPRGKAKSTLKRSKNKDNDAYSSKKVSGEKMRKSSHKTRSAPRPAPQPRSRRAAALIADQKIRNSIHCDTSQEQHRNGLTHDVELSRPHSSQQGLPPNGLANINPNIDSVGVSQAQPQKVSKLFEKDVLNYDGRPGVTSDTKLRPQDGDFKVQASSHAVKLAGHQRQHPVAVPEQSTLKRVPVHKTNGILDHDGGNRQTEESQLARFAAFTASPEGNVYIRMDENEIEHDESISHGNSIAKNSSKSFSVICHENTNFESPAPHPYMSNGAQETCSSEGLVSVLERSDSQRYSHPGVTPISSMIVVNGSKSRRFVEIGGKRRATGPEKSYQKAENGSNGRATTAVMTTTPSKRGNGFALNLKKALLSVTMSDEHHPAPESRRQGQLVEQDKNVLDTSLVRQSTNSPMSQILEVGPFRKGHQNQLLETAEMDLDVSTSDALQESVKMPERLRTTVSPWESARAFHNMENTRQEKNAFSRQHDENEMQIDESPNEEQSLNVQARRIQKRPKEAVLQPVYTPHRIRRVNSTERLCARAFNTWVTPTKISRDVHRKSNLISFNSRGPRNQGVILNQKDQLAGSSQPRISRLLAADLNKSLKRKLPIEAEEPSDLEVDLEDGKRPRISTKLLKVHDMAQRRSSIVTDAIHRPSSQSTRVNENGSPMPFIRSRHFIFRDHGRNDSTKLGKVSRSISDDDHGDLLAPGDRVESEPGIFAPRTRLTKAKKISWRSSSGSSKRKRYQEYLQSPKTDQFAAHRLHPNGGFIDVHTETEILPVRPADPFVEAARPHQNSFLEMLRRSSNPPYKSPLRNGVGPPGLNLDKGLDENHINSPSTESSSSDSSSREQWWSSSESSSGDEGGLYEEERWRDKLQPHQKGQLDALYSISQVSSKFSRIKV